MFALIIHLFFTGLVAFLIFIQVITAHATCDLKTGVIDMQKIIQTSTAGKKAVASLEAEFKQIQNDFKKQESTIQKKAADIEKKRPLLTEQALNEYQNELQKNIQAYREDLGKKQSLMEKKQMELTKPIIEKVQKLIDSEAKSKQIGLVLEKRAPHVIWSNDEIDLTNEVIKKVNF